MNVLKHGAEGYAVQSLQEMLSQLELYQGGATGVFDENTAAAVRAFQEKNHMDATGIADDRTLLTLAMQCAIVR